MNWDAIGAISNFVAAIAVVATLVYVSRQIRDQNRALQTNIRDSAFHHLQEWNYILMSEPRLSAVFQRGAREADWMLFDEDDRARLVHVMYSFCKLFENIFLHSIDGSVGPEVWERNKAVFVAYATQPGCQYYLGKRRATFDPRFLAFIDSMNESPIVSGAEVARLP